MMKNSAKARYKYSLLDKQMTRLIIYLFIVDLCIVLFATIYATVEFY